MIVNAAIASSTRYEYFSSLLSPTLVFPNADIASGITVRIAKLAMAARIIAPTKSERTSLYSGNTPDSQ